VVAEAHHTEQILHGYMSAMDDTWRCFVLAPQGLAGERAETAARALEELGAHVALVHCTHPVVDIVPFQLLTLDLADARGANPDRIRRDHEPWKRARAVYE
jgi:fructoselysine-6-P-deglycase FrlB-like protein